MKRIRPFLATTAALTAASGIAVVPALASAPPASAAVRASAPVFCTGTSLVNGTSNRGAVQLRVPTVGDGTGQWHCNLAEGDGNVAVARLQIALDSRNCALGAGLAVDGSFGPKTKAAVVAIQLAVLGKRGADGEYGPITGAAMKWPVAGSNGEFCGSIET